MWLYFISHEDINPQVETDLRRLWKRSQQSSFEDQWKNLEEQWNNYEIKYREDFFLTRAIKRDGDDPNYPVRKYPYLFRTTFKDSDVVSITAYAPGGWGFMGNLGFICAISDDDFVNLSKGDAWRLLLPDENNILYVVLSSHLPIPEKGKLRRFVLARPKDLGNDLMHVYDMQGMLLSSIDNNNHLFIPPFKKGEKEHAFINGFDGKSVGMLKPSDGNKDVEREFAIEDAVISLGDHSMLHGKEEVGGVGFHVKKELKIDNNPVGEIYYVSHEKSNMSNEIINAYRLFAYLDEAYASQVGLLFAYYHLKYFGRAFLRTERYYMDAADIGH